MTEQQLNYYLSTPRFNVYLEEANLDFEKAYLLYKINIELSEAFYPVLAVIEISLRNAIHETLKVHFQDEFWFKNKLPLEFLTFVSDATQKLTLRRKTITSDRIIAELNFGFWTTLFNRNYASLLWKPLRLIFRNTPKHIRKRDTISDVLHHIRILRNRVYHYEPVFNNLKNLEARHKEMLLFLFWLDKDLPGLLYDIDGFKDILEAAKAI